jgi:hypothetical protein
MRRIALVGVNAIGEKQRTSAAVAKFADELDRMSITVHNNSLKMITLKGTHYLKKHSTENYFQGKCNGRVVHISLKKIVGEVRYW